MQQVGISYLVKGTTVLTQFGYKNIEDVLVEDKLLTHCGKFQNVLNTKNKLLFSKEKTL